MASSPTPAPAPSSEPPAPGTAAAASETAPAAAPAPAATASQPSSDAQQPSSDAAAPGTPRQVSPDAAGPTSPPAAAAPPSGPRSRRVAGPSATGKVSNKKKEALAQVPCKFFRSSNGCSAGSECAFAHTQGGGANGAGAGGRGKEELAVCQWFLKGNCRFGHKCALAHILPGQPQSMDRKNKRAQQLAQQEQAGLAGGRDGNGKQRSDRRAGGGGGNGGDDGPRRGQGMAGQHGQANGNGHVGDGYDSLLAQQPMRSANVGPPGMPRPLVPANLTLSHDPAVLFSTDSNGAIHLDGSGPSTGMPLHFGAGGRPPPHLMQHAPGGLSMQQPIPSSSAFGTSPFNSGSHSVFFSGSHEQGGAGPFASSAGRSFGDGSNSFSRWRSEADGRATDDEEGAESEEDGDLLINKEDFLPSSLSDLLTPAELSRRRRTQAGFLHAPGQSLPQGMAAGLSRLHALPPPSSTQEPSAGYAGYSFDSNSEQQHFVAPSSVLAQRANPLSLAMSMGRSVSNASLDAPHHPSSYGLSASPGPGMAFRGGSSPLPTEGNGIAINRATAGGVPQHPGMHRLRTDTVRQQPSPIALPTMGEEVDDGLFELE